jgi:hypothetical protein
MREPKRRAIDKVGLAYALLGLALIVGTGIYVASGKLDFDYVPSPDYTNETPDASANQNPPAATPPATSDLPSKFLVANVPFSSQAPKGEWSDPRQQDACEETSVLMAGKWMTGGTIGSADSAVTEILALSHLTESMFGSFRDSSAADTLKMFQKYWKTTQGKVVSNITIADMKKELAAGHVLIVPANGKMLNNPNFSGGGPERHMLVVIGYDDSRGVFITNDPGTRKGKNYPYAYKVLYEALRDYPTGDHQPFFSDGPRRNMIVIVKP